MATLGIARPDDEGLLREAGADLVVTRLDRIDMAALAGGTLSLLTGTGIPQMPEERPRPAEF
jgi:beta-phosphoglucomutase